MTGTAHQSRRRRLRDGAGPGERVRQAQPGSAPDRETAAARRPRRRDAVAVAAHQWPGGPAPAVPPAPPTQLPPPVGAPTDGESPTGRTSAASWAWLGTRTWPAYCAAGITAAYGMLKAYWVFGGTALWSIAPLSQDMIDKTRSHTAPRWFEIADATTVVLAVAGVIFALATVRPRRWLPVWLVRYSLWPLAVLMVLRAVSATVGDVQQLATGASTRTALWDLVLWSPLFLIWGLLWAATALTYARRARQPELTAGRRGA